MFILGRNECPRNFLKNLCHYATYYITRSHTRAKFKLKIYNNTIYIYIVHKKTIVQSAL